MKIFQVTNSPNGYADIQFDGIDTVSIIKNGNLSQLQDRCFEWSIQDDDSSIPDCPFFIGVVPIFRTDKISKINNLPDVNYASFKVDGTDYTALYPITTIEGALDIENSDIRYFRNGNIMTIDSYVFRNRINYPEFFKISELSLYSFITEGLAKTLRKCGFNNLELIECKITK